jgi:hypothetical protein
MSADHPSSSRASAEPSAEATCQEIRDSLWRVQVFLLEVRDGLTPPARWDLDATRALGELDVAWDRLARLESAVSPPPAPRAEGAGEPVADESAWAPYDEIREYTRTLDHPTAMRVRAIHAVIQRLPGSKAVTEAEMLSGVAVHFAEQLGWYHVDAIYRGVDALIATARRPLYARAAPTPEPTNDAWRESARKGFSVGWQAGVQYIAGMTWSGKLFAEGEERAAKWANALTGPATGATSSEEGTESEWAGRNAVLEEAATICESRASSLIRDSRDFHAGNEAKKCAGAIRMHRRAARSASPEPEKP